MVGRRGSWERDQIVQCRKPPTAIAYMENQKQRKKLLPGARWGSYDCYTVREFGPQGKEFRKGHTVTKPWHGDPMAALDRAFRAIIYHAANLPTRLQMLHRLYQDNDVRMARLQGRATASEQDDEDLGSRRGDDPTDEEGSSSDEDDADNGRTNGDHGESRHSLRLEKKRHGGSQQRRKQGHQEEVLLQLSSSRKPTAVMQEEPFARPVPCKRRRTRYERWDWDWDFGPDFTAQDAVGFFGYFNGGGYVDNGPWAKPVEKGRGVTTIQQGLPSPGKSREIR